MLSLTSPLTGSPDESDEDDELDQRVTILRTRFREVKALLREVQVALDNPTTTPDERRALRERRRLLWRRQDRCWRHLQKLAADEPLATPRAQRGGSSFREPLPENTQRCPRTHCHGNLHYDLLEREWLCLFCGRRWATAS